MLFIASTVLFPSCSDSDACEGIICEYDGECDNGDCICVDLTENFLVGTWDLSSTGNIVGTFNADNTFIDSFGNVVAWELDSCTNTISVIPGNMLIVSEDGFSCNQMNVTIDNGTTLTDFIFIRQ